MNPAHSSAGMGLGGAEGTKKISFMSYVQMYVAPFPLHGLHKCNHEECSLYQLF